MRIRRVYGGGKNEGRVGGGEEEWMTTRKSGWRRGRMDENEEEWMEDKKINEPYMERLLTRSLEDLSVDVSSLSE